MKGFPNQVSDLQKIAVAARVLVDLIRSGANPRDDGVFGEALVRAGVAGTGHTPKPIDDYLRAQLRKPRSSQSFRTTARGLRELFRVMGLIDDSGEKIRVLDRGREAAASELLSPEEQLKFWRRVVRDIHHDGGSGHLSHPYQVLLRLVARKPGILRAKCALALEALDDSSGELDRIVSLVDLPEDDIKARIGVSNANWDNSKKILPTFAEQLGDVIRRGSAYYLADAPGLARTHTAEPEAPYAVTIAALPRAPRSSREVGTDGIARFGTSENFDEVNISDTSDPEKSKAAVLLRLKRYRRHNEVVRAFARRFAKADVRIYEDPFDILVVSGAEGILVEVKSLDGTEVDERDRVKEALAQLLYYEAFVVAPSSKLVAVLKVACFEREINEAHQRWLNAAGIAVVWLEGERFRGDALAVAMLGRHLGELL